MVGIFTHISAFLTVLGKRFQDKAKGATAVEYGIMVALIAAVIIGVVVVLGTEIKEAFETVVTALGGTLP